MTRAISRSLLQRALRTGRIVGPPSGATERPTMVAEDLAAVCSSGGPSTPSGLRLQGLTVGGRLDLAHADLPFPLSFEDCVFDEPICMHGAHFPALTLRRCELPAVEANGLQIDHDLVLSGSVILRPVSSLASESAEAAIWLCESSVGGRVLMVGTQITAPGQRAIQADRMVVGGTMRLIHNFVARGEVRLIGIQVHGSLDLTGAHVTDPHGGVALDLGSAHIDGSVFIIPTSSTPGSSTAGFVGRPPVFEGRIDAGNAVLGGRWVMRDVTIEGTVPTPGIGYSSANVYRAALLAAGLQAHGGVEIQGDSRIHGGIDLEGCEIALLDIDSTVELQAPGLDAIRLSAAHLRSGLFLGAGLSVKGSLRFTGAVIGGNVVLRDTTWSDPSGRSVVSGQAGTIKGELSLDGLVARGGAVNLRSATLNGTVNLNRSVLDNPAGLTLDLHQATVTGSVIMEDLRSDGCLLLSRAVIAGELRLDRAELHGGQGSHRNPDGHAFDAEFAEALGGMSLQWTSVQPSLTLEGAQTTVLADDPRVWPQRSNLGGFTYQRFQRSNQPVDDRRWDVSERLHWLASAAVFDPGPYEQLARVLHEHGLVQQSERVLIEARRRALDAERAITSHLARAVQVRGKVSRGLRRLFGLITGYGYRPSRALLAVAALTVVVGVSLLVPANVQAMRATDGNGKIFSPAAAGATNIQDDRCGGGAVVCFNPAYYAIDTVVPLIGLGQRSTWHPEENTRTGALLAIWLNVTTLVGWLLTSLFALALTKAVRATP